MASRKRKKKDSSKDSVSFSMNYSMNDYMAVDLTNQLHALERTLHLAREIEAIDYIDILIDVMDEYPDAQTIINKVRRKKRK